MSCDHSRPTGRGWRFQSDKRTRHPGLTRAGWGREGCCFADLPLQRLRAPSFPFRMPGDAPASLGEDHFFQGLQLLIAGAVLLQAPDPASQVSGRDGRQAWPERKGIVPRDALRGQRGDPPFLERGAGPVASVLLPGVDSAPEFRTPHCFCGERGRWPCQRYARSVSKAKKRAWRKSILSRGSAGTAQREVPP